MTGYTTTEQSSPIGIREGADFPKPSLRENKRKKHRRQILDRIKKSGKKQPLKNLLLEKLRQLAGLDAEARRITNRDIATFFQYYDGNEYGEFDDDGNWEKYPDDKIAYSMLLVPSQVDSGKTTLLKTRLEYETNPKFDDSMLDRQMADMCQDIASEEMERAMTEKMRAREVLYLLLAGQSYREHYYAVNPLHSQTAEIPEYSYEKITVGGDTVCAQCYSKMSDDADVCPQCGSTELESREQGETGNIQTTTREIDLPENQIRIPNPLAIQHDLTKDDINYSFFIERDLMSRNEAEYLYDQIFTSADSPMDSGVLYERELQRQRVKAGLATEDETVSQMFIGTGEESVQRTRVWLPVYHYANIPVLENNWHYSKTDGLIFAESSDDTPQNSKSIKYGSFLRDIFPNGMYLCFIAEDCVEINEGQVSERWLKTVCGIRPANADGSGFRRIRSLADIKNDSYNLKMKVQEDDANPQTFVNRKMVSNLAPVGSFNFLDLQEGERMSDAVWQMPGAAAHPSIDGTIQEIDNIAQYSAGTFSSIGNGAPGSIGGTATAVLHMSEESAGRFIETVRQIASSDIESRYMFLENIQKYAIEPVKKQLTERFGKAVAQRFFEANLRQIVKITVKKGTDQPKSQTVQMAKMQSYGQIAAQLAQHPNGQQMLADFAQAIDLPISVGEGLNDKAEAERRIGLLREWSKQFTDVELSDELVLMSAVGLVGKLIAYTEKEIDVAGEALQEIIAAGITENQPSAITPMQPALQLPPMMASPSSVPNDFQQNNGQMPPEMPPEMMQNPPMPPMPPPDEPDEPPVASVIMMQEHLVFMDVYKDFAYGTGANLSNPVLQFAVNLLYKLHSERNIIKQTELMMIEARKQAEMQRFAAKVQAEMQPPPPSPEEVQAAKDEQTEAENANIEQEMMMDVGRRVLDDEQKSKDFQRQERAKDADLERDALRSEHSAAVNSENSGEKENNE